eukprot:2832314-Amphidinium_carterae.1
MGYTVVDLQVCVGSLPPACSSTRFSASLLVLDCTSTHGASHPALIEEIWLSFSSSGRGDFLVLRAGLAGSHCLGAISVLEVLDMLHLALLWSLLP